MNDREKAQWFLDQYRAAHGIASSYPVSQEAAKDLVDRVLRNLPEQALTPDARAAADRVVTQVIGDGLDAVTFDEAAKWQDHIATIAAPLLDGRHVEQRPLIRLLRTGQLNAVTMPVPDSEAYLVLLEDQLIGFAFALSLAIAWTLPQWPADRDGTLTVAMGVRDVIERIETHPEIADRFTNVIVDYAVMGRIGFDFDVLLPVHGEFWLAQYAAVMYFVLGHEYAHIALGHLDTTAARKGVLPDVEVLVYSWRQEFDADLVGMMLSIVAMMKYQKFELWRVFLGTSLFFDALDVMDRAIALLKTGDENALQLGSHPPCHLRKQRLRESLEKGPMGDHPARNDPRLRAAVQDALLMDYFQAEIIRQLWERTRPILLELRRRSVPAAHTWRTVPKETDDQAAPAPGGTIGSTILSKPTETLFLVTRVWDLPNRDGLVTSGKTLTGKVRKGMTLQNDAGHKTRVLNLEFLSPRDIATGEVTITLERTDPSPVRSQALLTATLPAD